MDTAHGIAEESVLRITLGGVQLLGFADWTLGKVGLPHAREVQQAAGVNWPGRKFLDRDNHSHTLSFHAVRDAGGTIEALMMMFNTIKNLPRGGDLVITMRNIDGSPVAGTLTLADSCISAVVPDTQDRLCFFHYTIQCGALTGNDLAFRTLGTQDGGQIQLQDGSTITVAP